ESLKAKLSSTGTGVHKTRKTGWTNSASQRATDDASDSATLATEECLKDLQLKTKPNDVEGQSKRLGQTDEDVGEGVSEGRAAGIALIDSIYMFGSLETEKVSSEFKPLKSSKLVRGGHGFHQGKWKPFQNEPGKREECLRNLPKKVALSQKSESLLVADRRIAWTSTTNSSTPSTAPKRKKPRTPSYLTPSLETFATQVVPSQDAEPDDDSEDDGSEDDDSEDDDDTDDDDNDGSANAEIRSPSASFISGDALGDDASAEVEELPWILHENHRVLRLLCDNVTSCPGSLQEAPSTTERQAMPAEAHERLCYLRYKSERRERLEEEEDQELIVMFDGMLAVDPDTRVHQINQGRIERCENGLEYLDRTPLGSLRRRFSINAEYDD
ncbi:hypothetical protein FRC01_001724, partial [Tulasnella sp. 417]